MSRRVESKHTDIESISSASISRSRIHEVIELLLDALEPLFLAHHFCASRDDSRVFRQVSRAPFRGLRRPEPELLNQGVLQAFAEPVQEEMVDRQGDVVDDTLEQGGEVSQHNNLRR